MQGETGVISQRTTPLIDLVTCLSDAMDYISPVVVRHHARVAYLAEAIGEAMGWGKKERADLLIAGTLHDIGAFSLRERLDLLRFEVERPSLHAARGAAILGHFAPLARLAPTVRHHHQPWKNGRGARRGKDRVPSASHVLNLADRISVLVNPGREILGQVGRITERVGALSGPVFLPEAVDAFLGLAARESFWFDLVSPAIEGVLASRVASDNGHIGLEDLEGFSRLFSRIIDFKSPFTASHSRGVAAVATVLSRLSGMSAQEAQRMGIAANLHDLGKLAVPVEILDKPARLNRREFHVVRHHTFYTRRILERLPSLGEIIPWAAFHHERVDGKGYPFHMRKEDLPLGSQVMAVADVFSALTEQRPYRAGMSKDDAAPVLWGMVKDGALNGEVVSTLCGNYDYLDERRREAQREAAREYRTIS